MNLTHPNIFSVVEMTDAINKLPATPLRFAPLFESKGVNTTMVSLDIVKGHIVLAADTKRGEPAKNVTGKTSSRQAKIVPACHLPQFDHLYAEDLQDKRAFGTTAPKTWESTVNDKILALKRNLEMTLEFHRLGAIKGVVFDADGTSKLYDMFELFNVSKKTVALIIPKTEDMQVNPVLSALDAAKRSVNAGMGGIPFVGYACVMGSDAYDALIGNKYVREAYERWAANQANFGTSDHVKTGFSYAGITFFDCSDVVGGRTMVEANKGHLYPVGAGIFKTYFAPADWVETVNTEGLPFYSRMEMQDEGLGAKVLAQSNPLCLCTYPEALVEISVSKA